GDHETAASQSLQPAEQNELGHAPAQAAQRGPQQEEHDTALEDDLAPVQIAELPVERRDDGLGEQVRGDDPREVRQAAQLTDDGGKSGGNDRGVQRGQQQDEQQSAEGNQDLAVGQLPGRVIDDRRCHEMATRKIGAATAAGFKKGQTPSSL